MNLLVDGIANNTVIKTNKSDDLRVDGVLMHYDVYKIRLENLYYNDLNDRIATRISQYKQDNGVDSISKDDIEQYNAIIHNFIEESNFERLKETMSNIKVFGQKRYGVVLSDGRIIDGNRRYTCLRNLAKDDSKFNYFEAIILHHDIKHNAKAIKTLELELQIGEDKPVEYDPIDRLVGVYRDIIENKLLTIEEYHDATHLTVKVIKQNLEIAQLMMEFLEAINAPKQFYIARDLKLDGPLRELHAAIAKEKDPDLKEKIKYIGFANIAMEPEGDLSRFIRPIKDIVGTPLVDDFVEIEQDLAEQVFDSLAEKDRVTADDIKDMRADEELKQDFRDTMEIHSEKVNVKKIKNKPASNMNKALKMLQDIDVDILSKLNQKNTEEILEYIDSIEDCLHNIKDNLDVY